MDIPKSVAIIMDGNRRWARKRHLPLLFGHEKGSRNIEPIVEYAKKKGITHMTFWAFSTENWKRSQEEIEGLMQVFRKAFRDPMLKRLADSGVRIQVIGDISPFPEDIQQAVQDIVAQTKDYTTITVNFALNYGGRQEILQAVNALLQKKKQSVTEEEFSQYLYTADQPDPDLIIRTGGEIRLSGYLPWQGVYSELYFTETLWPDFNEQSLNDALDDYATRQRRFGK